MCFIGGVNLWCDRKKPMSPLNVNKTTGWEESVSMIERADQRICINVPTHSTAHMQVFFFLAKHRITQVCQHSYGPDLAPCDFWFFPKLNSQLTLRIFVNATLTLHELSQRRLTADWLDPRESDCKRMHSNVSSDWLSSYIKATRLVLVIFKMAGYFPDRPRNCRFQHSFE